MVGLGRARRWWLRNTTICADVNGDPSHFNAPAAGHAYANADASAHAHALCTARYVDRTHYDVSHDYYCD